MPVLDTATRFYVYAVDKKQNNNELNEQVTVCVWATLDLEQC